jgi:transcriptional regulator with XRE-family HTH domain
MGKGLRSDEHKAFIAVLVGTRKAKGLTQEQLAKRLKKPQSYISKIESGERTCGVGEFIRIARGLRMDPKLLFARVVDW